MISCAGGENVNTYPQETQVSYIEHNYSENIGFQTNGLLIYNNKGKVYVIIHHEYITTAYAVFDFEKRELEYSTFTCNTFQEGIGSIRDTAEMEELLGQPNTDIGSGMYLPTYVFTNGDIIVFRVYNGKASYKYLTNVFDMASNMHQ